MMFRLMQISLIFLCYSVWFFSIFIYLASSFLLPYSFVGTENVFRGYGITCIVIFVAYFSLNFFYIRKLAETSGGDGVRDEPKHFFEEGAHLAPCGVPMGMNRNLSSSKLEELAKQQQMNSSK